MLKPIMSSSALGTIILFITLFLLLEPTLILVHSDVIIYPKLDMASLQ